VENVIPTTASTGTQQPLNKVSDLVRTEVALAGYKECLNFALCSIADVSTMLRRPVDPKLVKIGNPKTHDFEVGRTTLIPGLLKTAANNKSQKLPLLLFEMGDTIIQADTETGTKNKRHLAVLYTNHGSSGFELIHGLLDHLMLKLKVKQDLVEGYSIKESQDPTFFPERQSEIFFKSKPIGNFGIIHPEVLGGYEWPYPTSMLEIDIESLIDQVFIKSS